eukprot:SAG22_NODE_1989_length_3201_cov_1.728240_4_plen_97_part_00
MSAQPPLRALASSRGPRAWGGPRNSKPGTFLRGGCQGQHVPGSQVHTVVLARQRSHRPLEEFLVGLHEELEQLGRQGCREPGDMTNKCSPAAVSNQ